MEKKGKFHYGFVIVAAIFAQYLIGAGIFFGASGMFIIPVSQSLGIGQGQFTLYMTILNIAMATCTIFAGKLLGKYDFKRLNTIAAFTAAFSLVLMGIAQNIIMLYVGGALAGVSLTFLTFLSPGTVLPRWFNQKLGTMLAVVSSASAIGGIILNPLIASLLNSTLIQDIESWRTTYLILALMLFVICFPAALLIQNYPADKKLQPFGDAPVAESLEPEGLSGVPKERAVKSIAFVFLLLMEVCWCICTMILSYLPAYASTSSASDSVVGIIGSAAMLGSVIGGFVIGAVNDKTGGHWGGVIGSALGLIGFILLLIGANSSALLLIGAAFFGLFYCIGNVQLPAMVRTVFGSKDYSRIFPVAAIIAPWAGAVSSSLWGFLYDATGSYHAMIISGIILCICIGTFGVLSKASSKKLY